MSESVIALMLPYPPSVNHYWRRVGRRTILSEEGRTFKERVAHVVASEHRDKALPLKGDVSLNVILCPPDKRKRDLDNVLKALLDSLEYAGVYEDDAQVMHLEIRRTSPGDDGRSCAYVEVKRRHVLT